MTATEALLRDQEKGMLLSPSAGRQMSEWLDPLIQREITIYEEYGIFEDDDGNSLVGLAEILLSKNRNGPIGDIILRFREEFAKFTELDEIPVSEMSSNDDLKTYTVGSKMNNYSGQKGKGGSNKNPEASNEPPF